MKINIKTREEIEIMVEGGDILGDIFLKTLLQVKAGVKTIELERFAAELIEKSGAKPSFKTVNHYQFTTCMCVNDVVVHGLPNDYVLQEGDILGIDMGVLWKGFHTDASWSVIVGCEKFDEKVRFLQIGKEALHKAIEVAVVGNYVWDISHAIQDTVEKKGGYHCVRVLTGHGVGKILHEDPFIPCYIEGKREKSPRLTEGMTLAIEVIYGQKTGQVWYGNDDGWTITTKDGSWAGLFEETIAVTSGKPRILTHLVEKANF
jgi:methionyl aminopeptidase